MPKPKETIEKIKGTPKVQSNIADHQKVDGERTATLSISQSPQELKEE